MPPKHTSFWCSRCNSNEKQPERTCDLHSYARRLFETVCIIEELLTVIIDTDALRNENEELHDKVNIILSATRNTIKLVTTSESKNERT